MITTNCILIRLFTKNTNYLNNFTSLIIKIKSKNNNFYYFFNIFNNIIDSKYKYFIKSIFNKIILIIFILY